MLALQVNRAVSTDRLIEGPWDERAPPSAVANGDHTRRACRDGMGASRGVTWVLGSTGPGFGGWSYDI
jgi:hypothetical protein